MKAPNGVNLPAAPVYALILGEAGVTYGTVAFDAGAAPEAGAAPVAAGSALVCVFMHPHSGSITVT